MKSIKKAQDGLTTKDRLAQAKENRRKLDSITAIKRAEIVRKKDSILVCLIIKTQLEKNQKNLM
jgi:hypothetical protein